MLEGRLARGAEGYDERSFMHAAAGRRAGPSSCAPDGLEPCGEAKRRARSSAARMTQLVASLGTPFAFDPPDGCVLFFEDVNERPYRIDRMLTQLRLSGILARARGARVRRDARLRRAGRRAHGARRHRAIVHADFPGPVLIGFPSGHTTGPCWTLPLGVAVSREGRRPASLIVEESPVD